MKSMVMLNHLLCLIVNWSGRAETAAMAPMSVRLYAGQNLSAKLGVGADSFYELGPVLFFDSPHRFSYL